MVAFLFSDSFRAGQWLGLDVYLIHYKLANVHIMPKIVYLEGILMENGEFISHGKSIGYCNKKQIALVEKGACKITKGGETIIALGENIA